ncbi:NB-ARC domain-containing disease resistance protein [Prunus dulcis]|uniref:NB-ARC domain-containing disease resistance protein n=1 Tax=Prunus dulcis TaxID=3755 RepID=A0A4Y1QUZ9_PRUDU|nr:NB-ARC domain-containing disease resistance protein [Prunus dulcis]
MSKYGVQLCIVDSLFFSGIKQPCGSSPVFSGSSPVFSGSSPRPVRIELVPESIKLMVEYKKHFVEVEVVFDTAVETLQCAFNDAIDNMIPKMPNLVVMSDKLNDLRLREARKAETRRASSRVTSLVRSLYAVVSNGNLRVMTWKTDDTFGFVKSERSEYRPKFDHFRRDRLDLLANIIRESKMKALQGKVFDIESQITQIDGRIDEFSDKLDAQYVARLPRVHFSTDGIA